MRAFHDASVAETKQTLKAGRGRIKAMNVYNASNAIAFLQLFDALAADVTVGTTVPDMSIAIKTVDTFNIQDLGWNFARGCVYALTTTVGGAVAPSAVGVMNATYE